MLSIENRNVVINSQGVPIVMGRNCELVVLDDQKAANGPATASPMAPSCWSTTAPR